MLSWRSELAQARQLQPGESTGYGRRFRPSEASWIGVVPVGYADGFRRDLTGTDVLVAGERRRVVGTVSMDAIAVELPGELPAGTPVTLVGDGILLEEHARVAGTINYELASRGSAPRRRVRREWWSMLELAREVLAGQEAWVVGGAVRDEFLCRPLVDLDIACHDPRAAGDAYARRSGGALFQLSERHGAWRVALRRPHGRFHAAARTASGPTSPRATSPSTRSRRRSPGATGSIRSTAADDLRARLVRAVSDDAFKDDPLRLLRAVRIEDELDFRIEGKTERLVLTHRLLVDQPAGERILAELERLSRRGFLRLDELGLLEPLGGSLERLGGLPADASPELVLVAVFGPALERLPISRQLRQLGRTVLAAQSPDELSARAIHRFRRATEPYAHEAVEFLGGDPALRDAVLRARRAQPDEPLVRGDELGLPPGPEVGRLLDVIEEERAAGTISTREEALELARQEAGQ